MPARCGLLLIAANVQNVHRPEGAELGRAPPPLPRRNKVGRREKGGVNPTRDSLKQITPLDKRKNQSRKHVIILDKKKNQSRKKIIILDLKNRSQCTTDPVTTPDKARLLPHLSDDSVNSPAARLAGVAVETNIFMFFSFSVKYTQTCRLIHLLSFALPFRYIYIYTYIYFYVYTYMRIRGRVIVTDIYGYKLRQR